MRGQEGSEWQWPWWPRLQWRGPQLRNARGRQQPEEARWGFSAAACKGAQPCWLPAFRLLPSRPGREQTSVVVSHRGCANLTTAMGNGYILLNLFHSNFRFIRLTCWPNTFYLPIPHRGKHLICLSTKWRSSPSSNALPKEVNYMLKVGKYYGKKDRKRKRGSGLLGRWGAII